VKGLLTIVLTVVASALCGVMLLFITWCAWELHIEGRAYRCTDDGISLAYWESADLHRSAGDPILPGWTWEKLEAVNWVYRLSFVALWVGSSTVGFRIIRSVLRDYIAEVPNKRCTE
jgi:hypothetical protein